MATFGTFVAGQVLTAAELNTAGSWSTYTPTWTQSATITKTTNWARYTQLGKWVQGSIKMTASSAGTATNKVLVGLPVNASTNNFILGQYLYKFSGGEIYWGMECLYESSTTMAFKPLGSGSNEVRTNDKRLGENFTIGNSSITGITVASGDIIWIQFAYEAA